MSNILLLFDIDGTLLRSGGCGKDAMDRTFEKMFDIQGAWGDTKPDGKTDLWIVNEIAQKHLGRPFSPIEWADFHERYSANFAEASEHSIHFQIMPGVYKLLEYLSNLPAIHLAIATGNIEPVAWMKLKKVRLHTYFRCGGFGESFTKRTELLKHAHESANTYFNKKFSKRKIYVIGDTKHDVDAAHHLQFKSIGVHTGSNQGKDFEISKPYHQIHDFSDLDEFLEFLPKKSII